MSEQKLTSQPAAGEAERDTQADKQKEEPELAGLWKAVQSAIWLLGLALIAWQDWWWPGMLVLVAISGLTQAALSAWVQQGQATSASATARMRLEGARAQALPTTCPACGGALDPAKVTWRSDTVAICPYCSAPVTVTLRG